MKPLQYIGILGLLCFGSCKKFLEVGNPPSQVVADYVWSTNQSAANALSGMYYDLQSDYVVAQGAFSLGSIMGLQADELATIPGSFLIGQYRNQFTTNYWSPLYRLIYRTNAAIEGLQRAESLTPSVRDRLLGEAYFLRAFGHFYLVNIYGPVPVVTTTDFTVNQSLGRTPQIDVYAQVIADLEQARSLLPMTYVDGTASRVSQEKVRPNQAAALALLARAHLYRGNWQLAIEASSAVISAGQYDTVPLNDVFLRTSKEAIWQLQPSYDNQDFKNVQDARTFVLTGPPDLFSKPVYVSELLLNEFENADLRKSTWMGAVNDNGVDYHFAYKYKITESAAEPTEYVMVLRLAEQYLIRAEARAMQGNIDQALDDINILRARAGLTAVGSATTQDIEDIILHERQVELFTEWGHRWFDLKRTARLHQRMTEIATFKGSQWEAYRELFDIPRGDLQLNKNMTQNEGYPSL